MSSGTLFSFPEVDLTPAEVHAVKKILSQWPLWLWRFHLTQDEHCRDLFTPGEFKKLLKEFRTSESVTLVTGGEVLAALFIAERYVLVQRSQRSLALKLTVENLRRRLSRIPQGLFRKEGYDV